MAFRSIVDTSDGHDRRTEGHTRSDAPNTDAAGQLTGWAVGGARGDAEHEQGAGPTGRLVWLCANGFGNLGPMWEVRQDGA